MLDIPLSDGIEEFVGGIKTAATGRGKDLLLIQVRSPNGVDAAHLRYCMLSCQ